MIGRTLGRYRIIAKLGEGGMGSVWRAEDPALGRTVALKLLSPSLWENDTARQRFLREARAASQLDHPNIATVYDVGETDGHAWIAYQFVDGETVAARTEHGPLPIAEALALASETTQALAHAHARGVLHRDVTAGNVMVTREGHAMLVDFGLALPDRAAHLTTTGAALGTAGYMAPEVMRGKPADERSDLYGLGAVLYRMLTGKLPFEGGPPAAVLYRVLNENVPPPSDVRPEIPSPLEHVVMKLLEREPADRHANAAEVAEELREVAPERGPSRAERARRSMARRWRRTGGALRRMGRVRIGMTALASIALTAAALWSAAQRGWWPGTAKQPQVIAVLPFENTSANVEETSYLSEGLGSELVSRFGEGTTFRVLPWPTSRRYGGSKKSLPAVAKELQAGVLLIGSFRADEQRLHVNVALVDGRSGLQRWSKSFDEMLTDLLSVQSNIAVEVATNLEGSLAAQERKTLVRVPTSNPEAYDVYLHGVSYLQSNDFSNRTLALPFLDRAIKLDSSLADAYVGRGAAVLDMEFRGMGGGLESVLSAERDFKRALELDPTLVQAQRGLVNTGYELGRPEEMLRIAADVAKHGDRDIGGLLTRGRACVLTGQAESALPLLERALTLDPNNDEAAWYRVASFAWSNRYEDALAAGKSFVHRYGEDPEMYVWMGASAAVLRRDREADLFINRALELFGDDSSDLLSILEAVAYRLRRQKVRSADTLLAHWIPLLRVRLAAAPDNPRVLGALIGLEGLARDTIAMGKRLEEYRNQLIGLPAQNTSSLAFAIPGIAHAGSRQSLTRVIESVRMRDLANLHVLEGTWFEYAWQTPESQTALSASSAYQKLRADIQARLDQLGQRYLPAIRLKTS